MSGDAPLPRQDRLIKLLRMTTSPNDGEALTAMRMATRLLDEAGWTWDMLINGKIVVVADPFATIHEPPRRTPAPARAAPQTAPPPPPPPPKTTWPIGTQPNKFPDFCYCCGQETIALKGFIFKPQQYHPQGANTWKVVCVLCNNTATVLPNAALPVRKKRGKSVSDLA